VLRVVQPARQLLVRRFALGDVEVAEHDDVMTGGEVSIDALADQRDVGVAARRLDVGNETDQVDSIEVRVRHEDGHWRLAVGRRDDDAQQRRVLDELLLDDWKSAQQTETGRTGSRQHHAVGKVGLDLRVVFCRPRSLGHELDEADDVRSKLVDHGRHAAQWHVAGREIPGHDAHRLYAGRRSDRKADRGRAITSRSDRHHQQQGERCRAAARQRGENEHDEQQAEKQVRLEDLAEDERPAALRESDVDRDHCQCRHPEKKSGANARTAHEVRYAARPGAATGRQTLHARYPAR